MWWGVSGLLELCFDQSTQGGLKMAQHCGGVSTVGLVYGAVEGATDSLSPPEKQEAALERARREAAERRRKAVPLGGNPRDVLVLPLAISMGDIREPMGETRRMLLEHWYEEIMERDWRRTLEAAERLKNCGPDETVRIWADGLPDSACGLLHAASLLAGTRAQISVVLLPPWKVRLDGIVEIYQGWGEVSPEEFGAFLPLEQPLTPIVLRML